MIWPFKKKPVDVQPIKMRRVCDLAVQLKRGGWLSYTESNITEAAHPWQGFLDWFHDRPGEGTFALELEDGGEQGFVRSEIRQYQITYRMEEVS
jgi:hypothetical protein